MLLSACTGSGPTGQAGSAKRPNIVFVLTDDLSTDLVQYMPHVEALADRGTSFSHYYVVDSLCCPSRSAIFTGMYPHDDGVFRNIVTKAGDGGYVAFQAHHDENKTYATSLHAGGYRTAMMGKYLNGYLPTDDVAPGWDEWDVGGGAYSEYDYVLNQDGIGVQYGHDPSDYLTNVLSHRGGDFIDRASKSTKPFALEVATYAPHLPATPGPGFEHSFPNMRAPHGPAWDTLPSNAPSWLANFPRLNANNIANINSVYRRRVQSAQSVDLMVAHLEQRLRADHELHNTYFVFSSDNGFHTGQYRMLPGKQTAFDTDIRVPLIVTGPGVPAGRTVSAMTSSIDLTPTFEDIAGSKPTGDVDGVSLLSLMHGGSVPADWQKAVLIEHHGPDFNHPRDPDFQVRRAGDPPSYEAIRTANALYVEYRNGEREYYDTRTDPDELHNLAYTPSADASMQQLHTTLQALEHCHGATQCQQAAAPS
ncbi:sulfatase [Jatrophihabitans endophyticus]|uniref:sulfatase family protein n=1 Tax=Jatrophihabitans endophyticus TaxID=1206085 RepID=UPI0026F2D59E|nr:sulfatase [Jatrophihabitans endophyticus]